MELIFKIASIGIVVGIVGQVLSKTGKDDWSMFVSLAGLVIVLLLLVDQIKDLFDTVKTIFTF